MAHILQICRAARREGGAEKEGRRRREREAQSALLPHIFAVVGEQTSFQRHNED